MSAEKMLHLALKQLALMLVVSLAVPVIGLVALVLLTAISDLFCNQLHNLMTLAALAVTLIMGFQRLRTPNTPS